MIKCKDTRCKYQFDHKCTLPDISINSEGKCEDRIHLKDFPVLDWKGIKA